MDAIEGTVLDRCCIECGKLLSGIDRDRSTCTACRSCEGKIGELNIAIRSDDDPERLRYWPEVRYLLRERFGEDLDIGQIWNRCTDWLQGEHQLTPNEYLVLPISKLVEMLKKAKTVNRSEESGSDGSTFDRPTMAEFAHRVNQLMRAEPAREKARQMVADYQAAYDAFKSGKTEWQKQRQVYFEENVLADEELLNADSHYHVSELHWEQYTKEVLRDELSDLPAKIRENYFTPSPEGYFHSTEAPFEKQNVGKVEIVAWTPTDLLPANSPKPECPLPPRNIDRSYRIPEIVTALVAIHDADGRFEPIVPADDPIRKHWLFEHWLMAIVRAKGNDDWVPGLLPLLERGESEWDVLREQPVSTRLGNASQIDTNDVASSSESKPRRKKSTQRGEAERKLISALSMWHEYEDGNCDKLEPAGVAELSRLAEVSKSSGSEFFKKHFDGHDKYKVQCQAKSVGYALAILNNDLRPKILNNSLPSDRRGNSSP